jgi:hypothetical protein
MVPIRKAKLNTLKNIQRSLFFDLSVCGAIRHCPSQKTFWISVLNANMYLFYKIGRRNEHPGITGLSHFFKHMMFNGATKYGPFIDH